MKALLFIAFLLHMPAQEDADAKNYEIQRANPYPTKGWVVPQTLICPNLDNLRAVIGAAESGGVLLSDKTYRRLNAKQGAPVCRFSNLEKKWKRRFRINIIELHRNVEAVENQLRDVLVLSMKKGKRVLYFTLEKIVDFGYTL